MYSRKAPSKGSSSPKNKTEQKKFEREIKKTGTIKADYQLADSDQISGFSSVTEEEVSPIVDESGIPYLPPPKKKAKSSGSSKRSRSNPRK
jgi:hypothetical protein